MRRRSKTVVLVAAPAWLVACNGGGAAETTEPTETTNPITVEESATTPSSSAPTVVVTTETQTTLPPTTSPPVTPPAPTTTSVEELKAQIAADVEEAYFRSYEMLLAPSLDNLEARVGEVFVPGSPAYTGFLTRMQELVELGDAVLPNDPDLLDITVENVELVGAEPYTEALVTVCEVENRRQVTLPENSPVGAEIEDFGSGDLFAVRVVQPFRQTPNGWLPYQSSFEAEGIFLGEASCPAA